MVSFYLSAGGQWKSINCITILGEGFLSSDRRMLVPTYFVVQVPDTDEQTLRSDTYGKYGGGGESIEKFEGSEGRETLFHGNLILEGKR